MRKFGTVLVAVIAMAFGASCAKKATPAECKAACQKKADFTKPAAPAEDPVQKVEADFQAKMQDLTKQMGQAMQAVDQELQGKLAEAKDDAAKQALNDEYGKKKQEVQQQFQPKFQELAQQKQQAVQAAQEAKAKAEQQAKEAAEKALQACADQCVKDRTTKAKVDCQLKAGSLDDFNKCK